MNICEAYALFDSQNYSKREMEIIYGTPEGLTTKEFYDLLDKADDKYDDWRIVEHLLHKYDCNGNLR